MKASGQRQYKAPGTLGLGDSKKSAKVDGQILSASIGCNDGTPRPAQAGARMRNDHDFGTRPGPPEARPRSVAVRYKGRRHWRDRDLEGAKGGHRIVVKVFAERSLAFLFIFSNVLCSIWNAPGGLWRSRVVKIWPMFRGQFVTTILWRQVAAQNRGQSVPPGPTRQPPAQSSDHDSVASARQQVAKHQRAHCVRAPSRNLRSKNGRRFLQIFYYQLIPGFRGPCPKTAPHMTCVCPFLVSMVGIDAA